MKEINYNSETTMADAPIIKKLGVVSQGCEMTPIVRNGVRYRVETNSAGDPKKCIFDGGFFLKNLDTGKNTELVGGHYHFFSAYCEGDTVCVFGTNEQENGVWGGDTIRMFRSDNLMDWKETDIVKKDGWTIYNTSVCRDRDGYAMAFEVGEPREKAGKPFTIFFARSKNLLEWGTLDDDICYSRDRYVACPVLRYSDDGYYYMICLEELPLLRYAPYIYRSRDFVTWEIGLHNPVLWISKEDRIPADGTSFDEETLRTIRSYMNINNCDLDLCEFNGKTYINYLTGNQLGTGFMCEAVYNGGESDFLRAHFK